MEISQQAYDQIYSSTTLLQLQHDCVMQHVPIESLVSCILTFLSPKSTFIPRHRGFVGDVAYCMGLTSYQNRNDALYGAARGGNVELVNRMLRNFASDLLLDVADNFKLCGLLDPIWALCGYARQQHVEYFHQLWCKLKFKIRQLSSGTLSTSMARLCFEAGRGGNEIILKTMFEFVSLFTSDVQSSFKDNILHGALRAGNLQLAQRTELKDGLTDQSKCMVFAISCNRIPVYKWLIAQQYDGMMINNLRLFQATKENDQLLFQQHIHSMLDEVKQQGHSHNHDLLAPMCRIQDFDCLQSFVINTLNSLTEEEYTALSVYCEVQIPRSSLITSWWTRLYSSFGCRVFILNRTKDALELWQHLWTNARIKDRAALLYQLYDGTVDAILFFSKQALLYTEQHYYQRKTIFHVGIEAKEQKIEEEEEDDIVACFLGTQTDGPSMLRQAAYYGWEWILDAYFRNGWLTHRPDLVEQVIGWTFYGQKWNTREQFLKIHHFCQGNKKAHLDEIASIFDQFEGRDVAFYAFRLDNPFCLTKKTVEHWLDSLCQFRVRRKTPRVLFISVIRCLFGCDFETCDGFFTQCEHSAENMSVLKTTHTLQNQYPHPTYIKHNNEICSHCSPIHRAIHKKIIRDFCANNTKKS